MINKRIWILFIVVFFFACNRNVEKANAPQLPAEINQVIGEQYNLVHVVYFKLKEKANIDLLIKETLTSPAP